MCLILAVFGFLGNLDMLFIVLMILFHNDLDLYVCLLQIVSSYFINSII